jgi:membrane-bound lytic murein transglycosylase D
LFLLCGGTLAAPPDHSGQSAEDVLADQLIGLGAQIVRDVSGGQVHLDEALLKSPEMKAMYRRLYSALQQVDMERLGELTPLLVQALPMLHRIKGGRAYADWLRQRIDYADVARIVMEAYPYAQHTASTTRQPSTTTPPRQSPRQGAPPPRSTPPTSYTKPPPSPSRPAVQAQRKRTSGDVEVWQRKLAKRPAPSGADALLPEMKSIFASEGVPSELAWLAEVESSFNPNARSPVGAVGLYQFMPATAQSLGLQLKPRDDREDPAKSARAAAIYLKRLHGRFDSWPLALAAYNAGEGRVNKLLREHDANDFDGISDHLPSETRMYVPKLDAVLRLREGKTLASLQPPSSSG